MSSWAIRPSPNKAAVRRRGQKSSVRRFPELRRKTWRSAEKSRMNQSSRPQRGPKERNDEPRGHSNRRPPSSNRYTSRSSPASRKGAREGSREDAQGSKCTHICSRRGIVLICTVLTNALVLICVVSALVVMSGMSAMGGLAGDNFNINTAYTPFQGTELQQVRDLDMQFTQMRSPGVYGGVAFSLFFGVVSLLFVVSGGKPAHLLPNKLLLGQCVFQLVGAVTYVIAVGLYLHFVIQVNSTDVCKMRERLYARQGYTWMNCNVGGADAAVALFGLITAILYGIGCALTGFVIRAVRRYHQDREQYRAQRSQEKTSHPQRAPLHSDIIV
ncbi:MARVEL domain-containing protein 3-like [Arapaima gigas]